MALLAALWIKPEMYAQSRRESQALLQGLSPSSRLTRLMVLSSLVALVRLRISQLLVTRALTCQLTPRFLECWKNSMVLANLRRCAALLQLSLPRYLAAKGCP